MDFYFRKINLKNHNELLEEAKKKNKVAKYVFVVRLGTQKVFKFMSWYLVNKIMLIKGKSFKRKKEGERIFNVSIKYIW